MYVQTTDNETLYAYDSDTMSRVLYICTHYHCIVQD